MGMNKAILHGHVGKDPELKNTQQGKPFARFSLATTEKWKDNEGKPQQKTEWHQIVAWGKLAENVAKLITKGQEIMVEGKIEYQTVADKNDASKKITFTSIKMTTFDFCGKKDGTSRPDPEPSGYDGGGSGGDFSDDGGSAPSSGGGSFPDDDIPF